MKTSTDGSDKMRKMIDCRKMPSVMNCSVKISADSEKELLEASIGHAVNVHGEKDTSHLREQIMASMENELMT